MTARPSAPRWLREFPDMTDMPAIPDGWEDISCRGDPSPAFERVVDGRTYRLWVDYPTAGLSRFPHEQWTRFLVERLVEGLHDNDAFARFSDFAELAQRLDEVRAAKGAAAADPRNWPARDWATRIGRLRAEIEDAILRTPTGMMRDSLTEANIHLAAATFALGGYDAHAHSPRPPEGGL